MAAQPLTRLKKCDLIRLVRSLTKTKAERMFKRNGGRPFEIAACNINRITKEQLLSKVYRLQEARKPKTKTPTKPSQPKQLNQKQRKEIDQKGRPGIEELTRPYNPIMTNIQSLELTIKKLKGADGGGFPYYLRDNDERWRADQALQRAENSIKIATDTTLKILDSQTYTDLERNIKSAKKTLEDLKANVKAVKELERPELKRIDKRKLKPPPWPLKPAKHEPDGETRLQNIGTVKAIKYGNVKKGTILKYNFGSKGQVISVKPKGKQSVDLVIASLNTQTNEYENHPVTKRKSTLIGLAPESFKTTIEETYYQKTPPKEKPFVFAKNVKLVKSLPDEILITRIDPKKKKYGPVAEVRSLFVNQVWNSAYSVDKGKGFEPPRVSAKHKTTKGVIEWANEILSDPPKKTSPKDKIKTAPTPAKRLKSDDYQAFTTDFFKRRTSLNKTAETIQSIDNTLSQSADLDARDRNGIKITKVEADQLKEKLFDLSRKTRFLLDQARADYIAWEIEKDKDKKGALRKKRVKSQAESLRQDKIFHRALTDARNLQDRYSVGGLRLGQPEKNEPTAIQYAQKLAFMKANYNKKDLERLKPPTKKRYGDSIYPINDGRQLYAEQGSHSTISKMAAYLAKKTNKPYFMYLGWDDSIHPEKRNEAGRPGWKVSAMSEKFVLDPRHNAGLHVYQINPDWTVVSRPMIGADTDFWSKRKTSTR